MTVFLWVFMILCLVNATARLGYLMRNEYDRTVVYTPTKDGITLVESLIWAALAAYFLFV